MNEDNESEKYSLVERLYLTTGITITVYQYAFIICLTALVILGLATGASIYYFQEETQKYGNFIDVEDEETGGTKTIFVPHSEDEHFSPESLVILKQTHTWQWFAMSTVIAILLLVVLWLYFKGKKNWNDLSDLTHEFIQQSYILNFEVQPTKGNTKIEKILNHATLVFPEVKQMQRKSKEKGITIPYLANQDLGDDYKVDLIVDVPKKGNLFIQFFENTVKFSDIEELGKKIMKKSDNTVFRVLCVAKEYDEVFHSDEIEKKMDELDIDFEIDLIIEKENGYQMLWID